MFHHEAIYGRFRYTDQRDIPVSAVFMDRRGFEYSLSYDKLQAFLLWRIMKAVFIFSNSIK
jgi:hypothetical protein